MEPKATAKPLRKKRINKLKEKKKKIERKIENLHKKIIGTKKCQKKKQGKRTLMIRNGQ